MSTGRALFSFLCFLWAVVSLILAIHYRRKGDLFSWGAMLVVSVMFGVASWGVTS